MLDLASIILSIGVLIISAIFILRVWFYIRDREDPFNPILLFTLLAIYFYLIPGIYLFITEDWVWINNVPNKDFLIASLVVLLFFILVISSYFRSPKLKLRGVGFNISSADSRYLFFAGVFWIVLGLVGYLSFVWLNGGFIRLFTVNRTQFQTVPNTQRYKILAWTGLWSGLPLVVSSAHELYEDIDNSYRQRFLFIVTGIVLAVIVATFSFRSRLKAGYPIAFLLLYTHYRIYKFEIKQVGIIAALGVIGIGGFSFVEHIIGSGGTSIQLLVNGFIYRVRFEPLIAVINAVSVERSLQFGTSLFYGGMWLDSGITGLGNQIELIVTGTNTSGLTIGGTVIAELYLNYGIIGVIIFAPIYGLLLKTIRSTLIKSNNDLAQGLYPAILFIMLAIVPTSIGWVFRNFVIVILPPIFLSLFVRQFLSAVSNQGQASDQEYNK